jgi:hypothetical protein
MSNLIKILRDKTLYFEFQILDFLDLLFLFPSNLFHIITNTSLSPVFLLTCSHSSFFLSFFLTPFHERERKQQRGRREKEDQPAITEEQYNEGRG